MIRKWRTLKDEIVSRGKIFRYRSVQRASTTQDMSGDFDVLDFLGWVNIVAITPDHQVLHVRQYRQGVDEVTLEIPGGAIDPGEEPLVAAKRELKEETGYESSDWLKLGVVDPNPAFQSNHCHVYLAKQCHKVCEPSLDPLEELEVELIDKKQLPSLVSGGEVKHSLVLSAYFLARDYLF
ncbi:MAG: hypothetical protein CME71_04145 [Halobacteriovorax sp.]|nr:hypothetical protein [Halobacteriovorax sp.]